MQKQKAKFSLHFFPADKHKKAEEKRICTKRKHDQGKTEFDAEARCQVGKKRH
jgi:hypothetical protein